MSLETNLNIFPFWDDYDPTKNYHRILFRPNIPVQVRELNQLQTIMQDQIERFGENIFKEGTIVKGCPLTFDSSYAYVKLLDLQVDGQPLNVSQFANTLVVSASGLEAIVVNTTDGLESQNPNLNTIYVKYQNSGTDGELEFEAGEVLNSYSRDLRVQRVIVANSGIGYSNNDTVVFTSSTGTGAVGVIVTDNFGRIQQVVTTNGGSGYEAAPSAAVANTTGGTANGTGAVLTPETYIAQLTVANTSFANVGNTQFNPIGSGYAVHVGDGVIFQKGFFTRVEPQSVIVSKYSTEPSDLIVGFETTESIVNNSIDTSLNDNAQGESNFSGPGAFRLKLTPTLVVKELADVDASNNFFAIVEFDDGRAVKVRQTTEYNVIGQEMARRTSEESGNYVVNPFNIILDDISANSTHLQAKVGAGVAYVNGYRVEQTDAASVSIRKGTDTLEKQNVNISINMGNFVYVNNFMGTFPFNTVATVNLYSGLSTGITSGSGTLLGTAKIRGLAFDSGTVGDTAAVYRLYLFDVQMNAGQNFASVRSIFYNGTNKGSANIILNSAGDAVIQEPSLKSLIFSNGSRATKTLRTEAGNNETNYIYSTVDQSVSFAANGVLQKTLIGDVFPYSGTLDSISERDFIFVAQSTVSVSSAAAGTIDVSNSSPTVTGTSTTFLSTYEIGDYILTGSAETRRIVSIANNTSLTVNAAFDSSASGTTHKRTFPAGTPISFVRPSRTITVTGNQMIANLGEALTGSLPVTAVYNVQRNSATQLTKNINKNVKVKLTTASTTRGPWCLGIPDVVNLVSVTKTSNSDYTTNAVDVSAHFMLDSGQTDTHYGLAYLRKKPTSTLTLTSSEYLVVTVDAYTHSSTGGGLGFFSVDSYPVDDTTTVLPSDKIRTESIPVYKSQSGIAYDLRDCVDFRPVVANTAAVTSTLGSATVNPSNTVNFSGSEQYLPAPHKNFETTLQYYVGRYDKVVVNTEGKLSVIEGPVTETPRAPADLNDAMTLATITVKPYPTLSLREARLANRPDYAAAATLNMQRRYTMQDIGRIEQRIKNIEYYTALNLLEKSTSDLVITSEIDPSLEVFKNGIFVDPLTDFTLTNSVDGEFTAAIDVMNNEITSRFDQSKLDLVVSATSNTVVHNDLVTLATSNSNFIVQPYASKTRTCSDQHWNFMGNISLFPEFFNYYDIRYNPNVDLGLGATVSGVSNNVYFNSVTGQVAITEFAGSTNIFSDQSFANQFKTMIPAPSTSNTASVYSQAINYRTIGDYINVGIGGTQFVYEHTVLFKITGLKPNTRFYTKFDGVNTSTWSVGLTKELYDRNIIQRYNFIRAGFGGPNAIQLVSDSSGTLYGALFIPRGYFFTGSRLFEVMDNLSTPTSYASTIYQSYNYQAGTNDSIVSTRLPGTANAAPSEISTLASVDLSNNSPFDFSVSNTGYLSSSRISFTYTESPLTQTFYVGSQDAAGQAGLYVTAVDLYFKTKDTKFGALVELRTVENGVPTNTIVPFSTVHLDSNEINTSNNASVATKFTFQSPVFLRAGYYYALTVKVDGNSPDYSIWCAQAGQNDVTQTSLKCRQDWGEGLLFTPTNDTNWQAVPDEDLKFTLYRSTFSSGGGSVTFTNRNDEFFSIANTTGTFMHNEPVFVFANTYMISGNVSFDANTLVVSGNGTSFLSQYTSGSVMHVANTATPNTSSDFTTFIVASVANNTSLTLLDKPTFSANNVKAYNAPSGVVNYFNESTDKLYLTGSTAANAAYVFNNGDTLIGTLTGAVTTIESVDNLPLNSFDPILYRTTVTGTSINGSVQVANSSLAIQPARSIKFNDTNYITDINAVVGSRSNEILDAGGAKSFRLTASLSTSDLRVTPTIDLQSASIIRYENLINNDTTDENTSQGNAYCKYVSKTVTLSDNQDAESLRVYMNVYKPQGTDVQVWARLLNGADPESLNDKSWVQLTRVGADKVSKITDRDNFYEAEYRLANTPATSSTNGVVSVSNASVTISGSNTTFSSELSDGDVIKISDDANARYFVTKVDGAPASNTSVNITSTPPWSATGATIHKFDDPNQPFLNPQNDGIVEYFAESSVFSTYKSFAIKIILLSSDPSITPRVKSPRVLALSV